MFQGLCGTRDGITVEVKESYAVVDAGNATCRTCICCGYFVCQDIACTDESSVNNAKLNTAVVFNCSGVRGDILFERRRIMSH
jgi:hypothetical protein